MRLAVRRPGTSTAFIDSASGERVLEIATDAEGVLLMAYHLYDGVGGLVAECALQEAKLGVAIHADDGELLLDVPSDIGGTLQYRLYGHTGTLLTFSDGSKTKIFPFLRMEGVNGSWGHRR